MYVFEQNSHKTSFDDWIKACMVEYPESSEMMKIEKEDKIIICAKEDFIKAKSFVDGEKGIPDLNTSVDILGDIENFDITEGPTFEYFEVDILNDVIDTRGVFNFFWKRGRDIEIDDKDGIYVGEVYPHHKGYPSFLTKVWDIYEEKWRE